MQCTACKKMIQGDFNFCPYCGNKMNMACPGCGKPMMADWVTCPYCRAALGQPGFVQPPQNPQYNPAPTHGYPQGYQHGHSNYHSDSSGHHNKRKKGLLGSFFS